MDGRRSPRGRPGRFRRCGCSYGAMLAGAPLRCARMRNPRDFAKPLAVGAPDPLLEIPVTPSRMIHFFDPSNEKIVGKLPELATKADILLGNLEDAISVDRKEAARQGLVRVGRETDLADIALWTRVNSL